MSVRWAVIVTAATVVYANNFVRIASVVREMKYPAFAFTIVSELDWHENQRARRDRFEASDVVASLRQ